MSTPKLPAGVMPEAWAAIGAEPSSNGWRIPERDPDGAVVGWATRSKSGAKSFMKDGKRGLTMHRNGLGTYAGTSPSAPVFVVEGATDTAAGMGIGLDVVGRPSANGGGLFLEMLLRDRHVCIVGENDGGVGRTGALGVAQGLRPTVRSVKVIYPPEGVKDLRAWIIKGGTKDDVLLAADAAALVTVADADADGSVPLIVRLSDVQPEQVAWLWPGRFALGKLTLLAGDPGLGKSFLTLDMAARVSRGKPWPVVPGVDQPPGGVVLMNAEDAVADTIRPRLDAAGADTTRIVALEGVREVSARGVESVRTFDLSRDLPRLEQAIKTTHDCRLVVIDPVTAYLGGTDSHKNAEVRGLLAPLGTLAARYGVAIIAVTHLNKSAAGPAIYRAMGSLAFAAAARAAWVVSKDPDNPQRRLFLPMKNNIAPDTGGLAYRISPIRDAVCPVVEWEPGLVAMSADAALSSDRTERGGRTERDDVMDWLRAFLADGPRKSADVEAEAKSAGFSLATLRRAKVAVGVATNKRAFGGGWECALPSRSSAPEHDPSPKVLNEDAHSPLSEHLREKQGENDGNHPKVLTGGSVSALGEHLRQGEHLGPPAAGPDARDAGLDGWGTIDGEAA